VLRDVSKKTGVSRALSRTLALVAVIAVSLVVAACGSDSASKGGTTAGGSQLIVATMGFPCSLNDFAKALCNGFQAGERTLPAGWRFELKTGTDYSDQTAYNNLIQTSMQLNPGGMIVFPGGSSAQVPVLKQGCAEGIKVITVDGTIDGLGKCQSSSVAANHRRLGEDLGRWLVAHPPENKDVGVVTFPPGQAYGLDERVAGFKSVVEPAGFKVVATVLTDLSVDRTRTQVTNMLTAHPTLGVILSANDQMGYGTAQAVAHSGSKEVMQLSIDGALDSVRRIVAGTLAANAAQNPYFAGKQTVIEMVKLLQGTTIPKLIEEPTKVVDRTNAEQYIAEGGLH
jgi:ribose transport system substrate-binding protein